MTAAQFACHQSRIGEEFACAGWLATVGNAHPAVRLAVYQGRLSPDALRPGAGWPVLHGSYAEVLKKLRATDPAAAEDLPQKAPPQSVRDSAGINLTPLRIKALQVIKDTPGIYLGTLAERLEFRGRYSDGRRVRHTSQGATRWGGGYAAPLVKAGLVRKNEFVSCGGAELYLTEKGEQVLREAAAPTLDQPLKGH